MFRFHRVASPCQYNKYCIAESYNGFWTTSVLRIVFLPGYVLSISFLLNFAKDYYNHDILSVLSLLDRLKFKNSFHSTNTGPRVVMRLRYAGVITISPV